MILQNAFMGFDRRRLLKSAAFLPAATLLGAENEGGCKLAMGTYGLQSMPLVDAIRLIGDTGFDALEIAAFSGMTGSPDAIGGVAGIKEIREVIESVGIPLGALMAGLKPEKEDSKHAKQLEELNRLFELAYELSPESPPLIQTILGGRSWDESKMLFRDRLADWIQMAGDYKIGIAIKPHRSHAMETPANAAWLIEQLGSPRRLGMVYDYSHYAFKEPSLSIEETVERALPITTYIAVKDAVRADGAVRFELPGEGGAWDHADIIRAFYAGGYRGEFCCEVSSQVWRSEGYDPIDATKLCYRNMVAAFERAGVPRG